MTPVKIGLLPLYIALYDDHGSTSRQRLEPFYDILVQELESKDVQVVRSPFCRLSREFRNAVSHFEQAGADCIVTVHMAYSPSLECTEALSGTNLPVVVLDTTETEDFGFLQQPAEINYCHGIHGVMDMCNLLRRSGKPYAIAAGHYRQSSVLDRVIGFAKAAAAARSLAGSKVGSIGGNFPGMGDFQISDSELADRFGVTVLHAEGRELQALKDAVTEDEIESEITADLAACSVLQPFSSESHRRTVRNCLAVRHWIERHRLTAFSVNFLEIRPESGLDIMPFMEACKALARGIGYAGEGDLLTAAVTGALLHSFPDTSFVEIFCPDWKGNALFISHFAEINYRLTSGKPELREIAYSYGEAENPIVGSACYRGGKAIFVNIFRDANRYHLLLAPVTVLEPEKDAFAGEVRGWLKPSMPVADFLEAISLAGVTHHSSLVYGATLEQLAYFGEILGLSVIKL